MILSSASRDGMPEVLRALVKIIDTARGDAGDFPPSKEAAWQP
jgi:hypothetical protein